MPENLAKIDDFIRELEMFKKDGKEYVIVTSKAYSKHTGGHRKSKPHIVFEHAFSPSFVNEKNRTDLGTLPLILGIMLLKAEELSPEALDAIKDTVTCKTTGCTVYTKNKDEICDVCKEIET